MADYKTPRIVGTFQDEDLTRDAASCLIYDSDSELKDEIRAIDSATHRMGMLQKQEAPPMSEYRSPAIVASYEAATLTADAAACAAYPSDQGLKDEVRGIHASLGKVGALREEVGASNVSQYRSPAIVASYAAATLIADAAACQSYESDQALKEDVQPIEGSVSRLQGIAEE